MVFHNLLQSGGFEHFGNNGSWGIRTASKLPPSVLLGVYAGVYVHEQTGTGANKERQSGVKKLEGIFN